MHSFDIAAGRWDCSAAACPTCNAAAEQGEGRRKLLRRPAPAVPPCDCSTALPALTPTHTQVPA